MVLSSFQSTLSQEIYQASRLLMASVANLSAASRTLKEIDGTGGKVSVADLVAYQIGWGKSLLRWYCTGIQGEIPSMPLEGFSKWNYSAIARHFYQEYQYDHFEGQCEVFEAVVAHILTIVEEEYRAGNLDIIGVWTWCTLPSGKSWPLSKWVRVNTSSPYKKAVRLINGWKRISDDRNNFIN